MTTAARAASHRPNDDSGVRRRPRAEDDLPDLTYLVRAVEPPPVPLVPRRRRGEATAQAERLDFDAVLASYRPSTPEVEGYFPSVPGIPTLVLRPQAVEEEGLALDARRAAVLVAAAVVGALLAWL